jgi:glycosyltransferase involved in cell wall biosynthesis
MTEPLGQSQVLPYMVGLAGRGAGVEILSFEPAGTDPRLIKDLGARLRTQGIHWVPLVRSPSHGVGRKAWEIVVAFKHGLMMALARRPDIVHARSYLPAAAADAIARLAPGARLLFDLRGMLGDEYVDGGNWKRESLRYRVLKRYERSLLGSASGIVVLTHALRRYLRAESRVPEATPVQVIPCCVDTDRFRIDPEARARTRAALRLERRAVAVYSGTLGSWYMAKEMTTFVAALRRLRNDLAWLVLTHADPSELTDLARAQGIGPDDLVVRRAPPGEMPALLAAGDLGLSFIRPCFSKKGSSPTKVAEYLAAGLPVVMNDGVGDVSELATTEGCVVLPASLDGGAIERAAARASVILQQPYAQRTEQARRIAIDRFSLSNVGVPRYEALYEAIRSQPARGRTPARSPRQT